ncbi:MAG: trypsin-like peptidase domain-containing protein [Oscillospiraceae bacterium]|nr:trypsin-like peptidase domain-containing protein [Oscillospiraceae bacterium]
MSEFENNNNLNDNPGETGEVRSEAKAGGTAADTNSTSSAGSSYTDYRNGYYRNPNPHQDEPVRSTGYQGSAYNSGTAYNNGTGYNTNAYTNSYTNKTGSENGYNYANYYTNPGNTQPAPKPKKNKGHKGLKITAGVTAAVLMVGASFAGGYFISNGRAVSGGDSFVTPADNSSAEKNGSANDSNNANTKTPVSGTTPSLLELASRKDAITIPEIVAKMTPSVVGVQATFKANIQSNPHQGFGFGYFGYNGGSGTQEAVGTGTGVVISENGYIVTNAHVVYDNTSGYGVATSVEIQMSDQETTYPADIVAYDVESDIAVLKVDETGLVPAEFGNSDECQVGELVVAIGNPLGLELQNTVTCGIISALNREITINDKKMRLIQTDTAINSGNSGGPLINSAGQVIGINSAKMSSSYSSNTASIEGIGFAIPITEAKEIVDDLIEYGYVTGRPQLGITCQDVSEAVAQAYNFPVGACIISVTEGGAADKAGLQVQDFIVAIDGHEIKTTEELNDYKNEHDAGEQVVLTIVRQGQKMDVTVTLEEAVAKAD